RPRVQCGHAAPLVPASAAGFARAAAERAGRAAGRGGVRAEGEARGPLPLPPTGNEPGGKGHGPEPLPRHPLLPPAMVSPGHHTFQRAGENDERVRAFSSVLLRRRGIQDAALTPLIEEGLLAALRLYLHQAAPVPLPWLADVFEVGSEARAHLLANCTEPELV